MSKIIPKNWLYHSLLALALLVICAGGVVIARGAGDANRAVVGDFNPISVGAAPAGAWTVNGPAAPAFGALVYDPDFIKMEQEARARLKRGLDVRLALSPYRGNLEFQEYVKKFDYEAGWNRAYAGTNPYGGPLTLIGLIDRADQDLREARDLYAYLTVYAPEPRFRADPNYNQALCGVTDKEDPNPPDPAHSGQVLDPVIDWCNFPARLRQAVREAANLRLLFGQQFMVDAMGLHFSGVEFVGGEDAVRKELAQLEAARYQYERAEQGLAEALGRALGSGCYVSDFYTQSEWSLLSRAIENQETAQHHIATRLSYMDIASPESVPQVHAVAVQAFRQASVDGYIKLIGMAGLAAAQPLGGGCVKGERPDGLLAAELATKLLETRGKALELDQGRNSFGFDVTFTPARPYKSSPGTMINAPQDYCNDTTPGDRGLLEEAMCAAEYAKELQNDEVANTRAFENSQQALRVEINNIQTNLDAQVGAESGCYRVDFSSDQAWYNCVDLQINTLAMEAGSCLSLVKDKNTSAANPFDTCMSNPALKNGDAKQALHDLRAIYMGYLNIKAKAGNIATRVTYSDDRNEIVEKWLWISGSAETAARVAQALSNTVECWDESPWLCGILGGINTVAQGAAGGLSMVADVRMENAEHTKEVKNLLLDESELVIEAYATYQQFLSKETEFQRLVGDVQSNLIEAQRARAYFQNSPANDPSYRMVRDSSRLVLAKQMEYAARMSYLAARRAEYEFAARLSASNFRISDIYRARTADDIKRYLVKLQGVTDSLAGSAAYQNNANDFKVSVAQHVLLLTDEALAKEGFTGPAAQAERTRRFRLWVAQNTVNDPKISSKPVLRFSYTTSLLDGGLFSQVIQEGYERYWLLKLAGIGAPKPSSNGMSINLLSDQAGLSYRTVALTQGGLVHLRSYAGCTFDYRLLSPAVLLGLEWASNQNPETATGVWSANVNGVHSYTENNFRTPAFLGRAVSSTDWQVLVYSGAPAAGMLPMDLQQLTDIELIFSTTYASREPGEPEITECTRIDW